MVDVVDLALAVLQPNQGLEDCKDVLLAQDPDLIVGLQFEPRVHLDPAHGRQIVPVPIEEQAREQRLCCLQGRRLARAHDPVDVDQRFFAVGVLVGRQGIAHIGPNIDVVDGQRRQLLAAGVAQLLQQLLRDLIAGLGVDLAGLLVDDVSGDVPADDLFVADQNLLKAPLDQLLDDPRRQLRSGFGDRLAGLGVDQIGDELVPTHALHIEFRLPAVLGRGEGNGVVEIAEDLLLRHALRFVRLQHFVLGRALGAQLRRRGAVEGEQKCRRGQLAAPVDAHEHEILGIELEIQPGAAIRDHARREEILARGMRLALVVVEEHARRAVHLADDDALGAVDDERAVRRHQRHVAHVDVLLLDVADRPRPGVLVDVPDDEPQRHLQRRGVGDAPLLALLDVVFRALELVSHEFQLRPLREIANREHRPEDLFQAEDLPLFRENIHLQECVVRGSLNLNQVRHRRDFGNPPEVLADTLTTRERLRHNSNLVWYVREVTFQATSTARQGASRGGTNRCAPRGRQRPGKR